MKDQNFSTVILVEQSPSAVFNAITNVRGWWSEEIEGGTQKQDDVFLYHYMDVHICKIKLTEVVPGKKVVWLVLDNHFNFTKDKSEWKNTRIIFDISAKENKTQLTFTHEGLVPSYECYNVCNDAWTNYIQGSLQSLITTGKGKPNPKEGGLNAELIEKWGLQKNTADQDYTFSFTSSKSPEVIFDTLLDINAWWSGLYAETIEGKSSKLNDEFTFKAGGGAHQTTQRLIDLVPGKKIGWLVSQSNLSFLKDPSEWENTRIGFHLSGKGNKTQVTFTHEGLVSELECYDGCTTAWGQYLKNLSQKLK